jgi:hypothetical protein
MIRSTLRLTAMIITMRRATTMGIAMMRTAVTL